MPKFINATVAYVKGWQQAIRRFNNARKSTTESANRLQAETTTVQKFAADMQVQLEKMNFKNKPHFERIAEAQERIQQTLHQK
jgi:predicted  nucleic acid-binding Zn-ribbon protein